MYSRLTYTALICVGQIWRRVVIREFQLKQIDELRDELTSSTTSSASAISQMCNARLAENLQQARDLTPTSALAPAKNRGRPLGYPGTVRRFNFFRMAIKIPYVILCLARASSYAAPCLRLARFLGAVPVIAT